MERPKDEFGRSILRQVSELSDEDFDEIVQMEFSKLRIDIQDIDFNLLNVCVERTLRKTFHYEGIQKEEKERIVSEYKARIGKLLNIDWDSLEGFVTDKPS